MFNYHSLTVSVPFQVAVLQKMSDYITKHCKKAPKLTSQRQREKYLKGINVKLVRHPKTDELMVAKEGEMQMVSGKRISATRVKEEEHTGDKDACKASFEKASGSFDMSKKVNTKAGTSEYRTLSDRLDLTC